MYNDRTYSYIYVFIFYIYGRKVDHIKVSRFLFYVNDVMAHNIQTKKSVKPKSTIYIIYIDDIICGMSVLSPAI